MILIRGVYRRLGWRGATQKDVGGHTKEVVGAENRRVYTKGVEQDACGWRMIVGGERAYTTGTSQGEGGR